MKPRKYSKGELIDFLQKLHKKLGRQPLISDLSRPSCRTFYNHFGSWRKALEAAGIPIGRIYKIDISDDLLISRYIALLKKLGRWPRPEEFKKYLGITAHAVAYRFGSLRKFYSLVESRVNVDGILRKR